MHLLGILFLLAWFEATHAAVVLACRGFSGAAWPKMASFTWSASHVSCYWAQASSIYLFSSSSQIDSWKDLRTVRQSERYKAR